MGKDICFGIAVNVVLGMTIQIRQVKIVTEENVQNSWLVRNFLIRPFSRIRKQ